MKIIKSKPFIIIFTFLVFGFITSQTIKYPQFEKLNSFNLNSLENGSLKADVSILVRNDNWFSFNTKELKLQICYREKIIAVGTSLESQKFNKKSSFNLPVSLNFYLDSLGEDFRDILSKDSILLDVKVNGKFTFLNVNSSAGIQSWIKTNDIVDAIVQKTMGEEGISLESTKIIDLGINNTDIQLNTKIKNKFPFELKIVNLNYSVYADEAKTLKIAKSDVNINKIVLKNSEEIISTIVQINNLEASISGISKIFGRKVDYFINGYALVEIDNKELKIPVEQHIILNPFTKTITIID
jgi:LEA14-like dessication related protein